MQNEKTVHINAKLQKKQINQITFFRFLKEHAHSSLSIYTYALTVVLFRLWWLIMKFDFNNFSILSIFIAALSAATIIYLFIHAMNHSEDTSDKSKPFSDFVYSLMHSLFMFNIMAFMFTSLGFVKGVNWPGHLGLTINDMIAMTFCIYITEMKCRCNTFYIVLSTGILGVGYTICGLLQNHLRDVLNVSAADFFGNIPGVLFLLVISCVVMIFVGIFANRIIAFQKKRVIEGTEPKMKDPVKLLRFFTIEKNRQIFALIMNIVCALIQIRTIILYRNDDYAWAFPRLAVMMVIVCCIIGAYYNIKCIRYNNTGVFPRWFQYILAIRELGGVINLYTVIICPFISDRPEFALFATKFGLDWTSSMLVPCLLLITNLIENHEANLKPKIIGALIISLLNLVEKFITAYPIVRFLDIAGVGAFDGFIGQIFAIITQVGVAICYHMVDYAFFSSIRYRILDDHVEHDYEKGVYVYACGVRSGIAPTSPNYYEFGQSSDCFVLRDANSGMVISCGSGLVYAKDYLKGCTSVDIFLTETHFNTMMGFLAVPNLCPSAKVRIFGPFGAGMGFIDMNSLAMPPLWPVNVIVGECISIHDRQNIRLNDCYSVRYYANDANQTGYSLRINGAASIFYSGGSNTMNGNIVKLAKDCDILIHKDYNGIDVAINDANQANVGRLVIANHSAYDTDDTLNEKEAIAEKLSDKVDYLRQGDVYNIA